MEFLKKHYEKILLALVLLGLVGALIVLPFIIKHDKDAVTAASESRVNPVRKTLDALDLSAQNATLARVAGSYTLDLDSTNKIFNPGIWQRAKDNSLVPLRATDYGIPALTVVQITPLYFTVSLVSTDVNELETNYTIQIEHPMAVKSTLRRARRSVSEAQPKKDIFTLITPVKGPKDNPDELDLKFPDSDDIAVVTKDKPYQKVDGYTVDLKYPPENRNFNNLRVGSVISFGGDSYTIVDIKANEVVLSAGSNQKRYTKPYSP